MQHRHRRGSISPVTDFLLDVQENVEQQRETFVNECAVDGARFGRALKRNKILNFASMAEKKSVKVAGKVHEFQMQRDLFGRMIGLSMQQKIDIAKILSYPLTPVPMSLCHLDGKICKANKSVF
ncbi:unnamed protein product [Ceutorhynchus assimilis]|uniref:Uncharacterized protein n=1 Tax=Ceutorhynchus assimilis TaxID=467358 RepID=A0A9N9QQI8_9CUCU|nr:unnamed protein product [Ceutorhynchus assimilis]